MKTHILLSFICIMGMLNCELSANPVSAPPFKHINELIFDEDGNWTIELNTYHLFDEIEISTTTGKAKIATKPQLTNRCWIITQADLDKELSINQEGDSISIQVNSSYSNSYSNLCFGNHPFATVGKPKQGQSIALNEARYVKIYSLCNKPTIGEVNGDEEIYATLKGIIYSKENIPIANRTFEIYYAMHHQTEWGYEESWPVQISRETCYTNENGEFVVDVLAAKHNKNIYLEYNKSSNGYYQMDIQDLDLNLYPNETVICDLHVTKSYYISIDEEKYTEQLIFIFPNPVGKDKLINYTINLPVNAMEIKAEMYSLNGSLVSDQKIAGNNGQIDVAHLTKGTYLLKFTSNGKVLYANKIIVE